MTTPVERIIIRHLSGSKANQIEQLPVGDAREFTIGRDPASKIAFDPVGDSVVSRKHAIIRMTGEGDNVSFKLSDAGSSNGTFLNGERGTGEVELLPEDTIELGAKGPKFAFDVQPRPAGQSVWSDWRVAQPAGQAVFSVDGCQGAQTVGMRRLFAGPHRPEGVLVGGGG